MSPGRKSQSNEAFAGPKIETESTLRSTLAPKARRASSLWSRVRMLFAHGGGSRGLQASEQDAGF